MRKWEKTFPDQLWEQVRAAHALEGPNSRAPEILGATSYEVDYEYLDPDVAHRLRDNAAKPMHGQNYRQWLSSQYGLRKLIEHIWKVIGIASTCSDIEELKRNMEQICGKEPGFQFELKLKALPQ